MRREFGGCAGNIAYNLNLLGAKAVPMATVGNDFAPYADWMDRCGITRRHIKVLPDTYTGQAFITTDLDDNQITAFHPGAMGRSHENKVSDAQGIEIGIVSPDGRDGMIEHAAQFAQTGTPFIFDPGQGMPMFNGEELLRFIEQASWATFNDYEAQLLQERTGQTLESLAKQLSALIVTRGANGSLIYTDGLCVEIPSAKPLSVVDPTGCGDAYRAGLLYGLLQNMDWETTGRIASLMGALKVEKHGTQNHHFTVDEFTARFKECFKRAL
jgi:adenosine kinase